MHARGSHDSFTAFETPNAVHKSDGWSYRMVGGSTSKVATVIKLTNYGGHSSQAATITGSRPNLDDHKS